MSEQQVQTVLGSIRVQVSGSGPAMLFWPSLLMTGDMWLSQAAHFSENHQVILVDPPGQRLQRRSGKRRTDAAEEPGALGAFLESEGRGER